jgi:IclR family acetate operon transcriptional repressor
MSRPGRVQSVERVVELLEALGHSGTSLSARELSQQAGLPRPTVYRLLQTLESRGLVQCHNGHYAVGPKILWLAAQRLEQLELRSVGRPHLAQLRDESGETCHLAVLEQGKVVYIDKVESFGPLRMASAVGKIMPAHCTALGKAMLSLLAPAEVDDILAGHGMASRTPRTITDPTLFHEELRRVRERGFAIDDIENEEGIRCVGAAVLDHRGQVAGALSVSGSAASVTQDRAVQVIGPMVLATARLISTALGWDPNRASG